MCVCVTATLLRLQIFLKADPAACHCDTGDGFEEGVGG